MKGVYGKSVLVGAIIGILAVGVAFAAFASTLTINGTATLTGDFDVKFTAVSKTDVKSTTTVPTIDASGVLSFDVSTELQEPGSKSTINYTISNLGSIAATLTSPSITCYSDSAKQTEVACSDANIAVNTGELSTTSLPGETGTATGSLTIEWLSTSTSVPATNVRYFTVTINANQA